MSVLLAQSMSTNCLLANVSQVSYCCDCVVLVVLTKTHDKYDEHEKVSKVYRVSANTIFTLGRDVQRGKVT